VAKFESTYIEQMIGRGFVHPDVNTLGPWTGRVGYMRPNLQTAEPQEDGRGAELHAPVNLRPARGALLRDRRRNAVEPRIFAHYLNNEW
jgi:hypothetical protein